ncbi:unnamed protein product [Prorocentrum cordatum]|uniref:Uncharacterized protein n=1 Tax=Prorocentrum cordatum TaxID=2364126 RepID=A0ABN9WQV4_9DINO|nr:unnamed protein product [Polarella glacialis]
MAGLLGAYEDSDEDDDAPSILARQASASQAEAAAGKAPPAGAPPAGAPPAEAPPAPRAAPGAEAEAAEGAGEESESEAGGSPERGAGEEEASILLAVPPSPPGEPQAELVERVRSLYELKQKGKSIRDHIQGSRDWSNPYILEQVIKVLEIDEYGSNYPKDVFDPAKVAEHPSDYYNAKECERPPLPKRPRRQPSRAEMPAPAPGSGAGQPAALHAGALVA